MVDGRYADPERTLGTDPRADPRMVAAFAPLGLDGRLPSPPLTPDASLQQRLDFCAATEEGLGTVLDSLANAAPIAEGVTTEIVRIGGAGTTNSTSTSAGPAALTPRCRVSSTFTAAPWLSGVPPIRGLSVGGKTWLLPDLWSSVLNSATPQENWVPIPIRQPCWTASPRSAGRLPTSVIWELRT
jgi:hypothetical protein